MTARSANSALAARLGLVVDEVAQRPACWGLPIGLLAEGAAAAAALVTDARDHDVLTVASCE